MSIRQLHIYPTTVTEGEGVELRLSGEAFGCYSQPIAVGVVCGRPLINGWCLGMDTTSCCNSSMINVSRHTLSCCLQVPTQAAITTLQLANLSSEMLVPFKVAQLTKL